VQKQGDRQRQQAYVADAVTERRDGVLERGNTFHPLT
jgi:hypothetical protein